MDKIKCNPNVQEEEVSEELPDSPPREARQLQPGIFEPNVQDEEVSEDLPDARELQPGVFEPNVQDEEVSDELPDSPPRETRHLGPLLFAHPVTLAGTLARIMEHLTKPTFFKLGVYAFSDVRRGRVVEKITRMVKRDNVFDVVVKASVTEKPDLKRIQEELGNMLGLQLHEKTLEARARLLCDRIKTVEKILIILEDLWDEINLGRIGIPFGDDHKGCKILLVSESQDVLSNQMNTQIQFWVEEGRSPFMYAQSSSDSGFSGFMTSTLDEIMMALRRPDIIKLGVYGSSDMGKHTVVTTIRRRVDKENLFDVVVGASVMKKPDLKRIQGQLGERLGLQLREKTLEGRARLLCDRIKTVGKILIILDDLWGEINLGRIGIPFGNDHMGCKILLLSESREVLSNQMNTQIEFSVDEGGGRPQQQLPPQGGRLWSFYNLIKAKFFGHNHSAIDNRDHGLHLP